MPCKRTWPLAQMQMRFSLPPIANKAPHGLHLRHRAARRSLVSTYRQWQLSQAMLLLTCKYLL